MSTGPQALNELRAGVTNNGLTPKNVSDKPDNTSSGLNILSDKKTPVTVNKLDNTGGVNANLDDKGDEFMKKSESEFGDLSTPTGNKLSSQTMNTTVESSTSKPVTTSQMNNEKSASEKEEDKDEDEKSASEKEEDKDEDEKSASEIEEDKDEDEKSAAELVAAAAAQIAKKTLKKPSSQVSAKSKGKVLKTTGKILSSGKHDDVMKKAMLMLNESGRLNVVTKEDGPSIVNLNTPANKAQIKIKNFRKNFEKHLADMRKKTPIQLQQLKAELDNIEFAEVGNKNIIAGLLELVDDHDLKMLTIEKMLKHGDITINF